MERTTAFVFGLVIGGLLGAVVVGYLAASASASLRDATWCSRIAKSQMPTTFAECLPLDAEVAKQ